MSPLLQIIVRFRVCVIGAGESFEMFLSRMSTRVKSRIIILGGFPVCGPVSETYTCSGASVACLVAEVMMSNIHTDLSANGEVH